MKIKSSTQACKLTHRIQWKCGISHRIFVDTDVNGTLGLYKLAIQLRHLVKIAGITPLTATINNWKLSKVAPIHIRRQHYHFWRAVVATVLISSLTCHQFLLTREDVFANMQYAKKRTCKYATKSSAKAPRYTIKSYTMTTIKLFRLHVVQSITHMRRRDSTAPLKKHQS